MNAFASFEIRRAVDRRRYDRQPVVRHQLGAGLVLIRANRSSSDAAAAAIRFEGLLQGALALPQPGWAISAAARSAARFA